MNGDYATKIADEAEEARKRIAEAAAAQSQETVTFGGVAVEAEHVMDTPIQPPPTGKVHTGANRMVKVYDFNVVDPSAVPPQFCSVDEKKIRAHVKYCKGMEQEPKIDGVIFTSRVDVQAR